METTELAKLLSTLGLDPDFEKQQAFVSMFNFVVDPPVPLLPLVGGASSSAGVGGVPPPPEAAEEPDSVVIKAFLVVFRRHFERHPFINFSEACLEAEAEFQRALTAKMSDHHRNSTPGSAEELLKEYETNDLQTQMETQKRWIEVVNEWKRTNFQKSVRADSVKIFRQELLERFPTEEELKFYEEADILKFSEEVVGIIVGEFLEEIPTFVEKSQRSEWRNELCGELSQVTSSILEKNRQNKEFEEKTQTGSAKYKEMMGDFLASHLFATTEQVGKFHEEAKLKSEQETGSLAQFLMNYPNMKSAWESKLSEAYGILETLWKGNGDAKIQAFRESLEAEGRKIFEREFNVELESNTELEAMIILKTVDPAIVRRHLEKVLADTSIRDGVVEPTSSSSSNGLGGSGTYAVTGDVSLQNNLQKKMTLIPIWICNGSGTDNIVFPINTPLPTTPLPYSERTQTLENQTWDYSFTLYESHDPPTKGGTTPKYLAELYFPPIPLAKNNGAPAPEFLDYTIDVDACGMLHAKWGFRNTGTVFHRIVRTSSAWCGTPTSGACQCQDKQGLPNNSSRVTTLAPIGVLSDNQEYDVIIPANTKLPSGLFRSSAVTTRNFATSEYLPIYEGEDPAATSSTPGTSKQLGHILWSGMPPWKEGEHGLDFTMEIDAEGVLLVEWVVRRTGETRFERFKTSAWNKKPKKADGAVGQQRVDAAGSGNKKRLMDETQEGGGGGGGGANNKKVKLAEDSSNSSSNSEENVSEGSSTWCQNGVS